MPAFLTSRAMRRAAVGASLIVIAHAAPALAQTANIEAPDVPLQDFDCDFGGPLSPANVVAQCNVDGARTVTYTGQTRESFSPTMDKVTYSYDVTFSGNLQVDGMPVETGTPSSPPFGGAGSPDASNYFDPHQQRVNVDATYTALVTRLVPVGGATPPAPTDPVQFQVQDLVTRVNSIEVDVDSNFFVAGGDYDYILRSIDPAAIVNNSAALEGSFSGTSDAGAIQFGRLGGTAQLVEGPIITPYPSAVGAQNTGIASTYQLDYTVTSQVTTNLDADGLITPQVTVTDGIEMNGSRIANLGDGVAPGDAVNRGQLDAEAAARQQGDVVLATAIAAETVARTSAVTEEARQRVASDGQLAQRIAAEEEARMALTQSLTTETNARTAADLALSSQMGAMASRLDAVEDRFDGIDDKIASSTAVAVAMGGAAFLPNMRFNLTANVGAYDGAQAGSLQFGALVTDHVAVNAGVATGFNKGGQTAGRVGMTIGW